MTLLANNGMPSNLNEEQWHQVRTPEFKTWFGDWEKDPENASKVLDENGEPMVVYHGSSDVFDTFCAYNRDEDGIFFTSDIDVARSYVNYQGRLFEVFLNIREPKCIDACGESYLRIGKGFKYILTYCIKSKYYSCYFETLEEAHAFAASRELNKPPYKNLCVEEYSLDSDELFSCRQAARKFYRWYDGIIVHNCYDLAANTPCKSAKPSTICIAYESCQIKATSNNGNFSNSDNMYE